MSESYVATSESVTTDHAAQPSLLDGALCAEGTADVRGDGREILQM